MSKKSTITNTLKAFSNEWKSTDRKIKEIYADSNLTPQGKEKLADAERAKLDHALDQVKGKIIKIIDEKLADMFKSPGNTFNAAYQSRLTNVLNILTLAGNEVDLRDLKVMIEPFEKDYTALQAINAAIEKAGIDDRNEYAAIKPFLATGSLENRRETHEKLVKFKNSLEGFKIEKDIGTVAWAQGFDFLGYDPFLDILDDNLDVIKEIDKGLTDPSNKLE